MGRLLMPIYALLLITAVGVSFYIRSALNSSVVNLFLMRFGAISVAAFSVISVTATIMMAVLVIQRFYKNLLGQEGYLMFTLPATTAQHLLGKGITAAIFILLGAAIGSLSGLIIVIGSGSYTMDSFMKAFREVMGLLVSALGHGNSAAGTILLIVAVLAGIGYILAKVYAAFAIGHLWDNHRFLGGILAYAAFSAIEMFLRRHLPLDDAASFVVENLGDATTVQVGAGSYVFLLYCLLGALVFSGITWYILDKRLNLE